MMKTPLSRRAHLALAAVLLATACGDDAPTPGQPNANRTKATTPAAAAQGATVQGQLGEKTRPGYTPVGKRDPFLTYIEEMKRRGQAQRVSMARKLQATEQFSLDQYVLSALITATSQPRAMVEDPEGMGHTIRIGSRLGKNGGRVTRITNRGIVVMEETRDAEGNVVKVPIRIDLRLAEEEDDKQRASR